MIRKKKFILPFWYLSFSIYDASSTIRKDRKRLTRKIQMMRTTINKKIGHMASHVAVQPCARTFANHMHFLILLGNYI